MVRNISYKNCSKKGDIVKQNVKRNKIVKLNEQRHMVITCIARASFPQLYTPRSFQDDPDQSKEFKIDLLFDPADIKKPGKGAKGPTPSLHDAYFNAVKDQFGPDKDKRPKFRYGYSDVFKKGDNMRNGEGEIYEGYEGKIIVTAKSKEKFPPRVFDRFGEALSESDMYGGCYVQAKVVARPYDFAGNRGVSFKLYQVIKIKDGERFGGGGNHELAFAVEEEAGDNLPDGNDGEEEDF